MRLKGQVQMVKRKAGEQLQPESAGPSSGLVEVPVPEDEEELDHSGAEYCG